MARWMQSLAVALAAVVGLVPAFAQLSYAQTTPAPQAVVTLPRGDELSDEDLLGVEGGEPISAIIGGAFAGGIGGALGVIAWHNTRGTTPRWDEGVYAAGVGALFGAGTGGAIAKFEQVWPLAKSAAADGARWAARAVAAGSTAAANTVRSAVSHVHNALHTVHVTLHHQVTRPVVNAARTAWDWITGK